MYYIRILCHVFLFPEYMAGSVNGAELGVLICLYGTLGVAHWYQFVGIAVHNEHVFPESGYLLVHIHLEDPWEQTTTGRLPVKFVGVNRMP